MPQTFTLEETRVRRANSVAQVNELAVTHQKIVHEGLFLASCPICRRYSSNIRSLSIPAENLPRFQGIFDKDKT